MKWEIEKWDEGMGHFCPRIQAVSFFYIYKNFQDFGFTSHSNHIEYFFYSQILNVGESILIFF